MHVRAHSHAAAEAAAELIIGKYAAAASFVADTAAHVAVVAVVVMFSAKRGASCVRNKIFSFGYRNDAPIRQRRKPAAAAAREVIERQVGFQKNEVEIVGRGEIMKEKSWDISWRAAERVIKWL
jgi:hypothetical protein